MPPEVMVANPKYDTSVDEFSYGIMMIHMFSGQWPEPQVGPNRTEPDGRLIPVTEAERREVFLRAVGNDHPLMDKILRCIDNDPQRRVHAPELLEHTSALKHEFPVAAVNYLEMQARVEALEGEKRTIEEEGNARVQNKEQQIARLGEEIQQKTEMIERQNLAHQNEILQMQQQVEDASTQAELQKELTEAKVEEMKSLSSQVETLSEERKKLRTDTLTLQSNMSKLSQQVCSLELKNSTLKQNLSTSENALNVKTLENEAVTKALKKKDAIISEKSEQLIKATEYIVSKKQVN
jgi:serine/threonine protein kinase